jgi:hypothetical protein
MTLLFAKIVLDFGAVTIKFDAPWILVAPAEDPFGCSLKLAGSIYSRGKTTFANIGNEVGVCNLPSATSCFE